jgi:Holliday junction resolvase RusA-like endonuclease
MKPFHLTTVEQARAIAKPKRPKKPKPLAPVYPAATEPVTVRLPFPPMLNAYYKIANVCGHAGMYVSAKGNEYKAIVRSLWSDVGVSFEGRLAVRVNVTWPNRKRGDLDGTLKCLLDALQEAGAYADDGQVKLLVVEEYAVEKPGWVTVTIGPKPGETNGTLFQTNW